MRDQQEEWQGGHRIEQDLEKMFQLIRWINELLEAKEKRLVPTSTQMLQSPV